MGNAPGSMMVVGMVAAGLAACAGGETERVEHVERTVQGACATVYGGDICTWGTMLGENVVAFGATVALASIENAPLDAEFVFPPVSNGAVALPPAVAAATGFDHLGIYWEAHGHPPGLFLTPHFDFHFFLADTARVDAIDCADLNKPATIPAGYVLPDLEIPGMGTLVGICVPDMGMHAMLESELALTDPFGASMLVGYYEQNLLFLEPMISRAKLLEEESFPMTVPEVPGIPAAVRWPTSFEAEYDDATRSYRFVFSGFPTD